MRSPRLAAVIIATAVLLYVAPYVAAWRTTHQWPLAPLISDHTYFYINSAELTVTNGIAQDPWYENTFPERDHPYRRFGGALTLFRILGSVVAPAHSISLTLALWNAFWIGVTAAVFWIFFTTRHDAQPIGVVLAVAIVLCVSFPHLLQALASVRSGNLPVLSLPFLRVFYPQIVVPIVVAYIAASIAVWRTHRAAAWVLMALLQAFAMVTFPYAVIILAATTAVAAILSKRFTLALLLFAIGCALIDAIILIRAGSPTLGSGAAFFSVEPVWPNRFQLALSILCGGMTLAVGWLEKDRPTRNVLCAFGIAAAVIPAIADSFISRSVEASIHLYYFAGLAIAVLVGWSALILAGRRVGALALGVVIAWGLAAAVADARRPHNLNQQLGEVVRWSRDVHLSNHDLVISRSEADDEPASYLPLLGHPNVLFYYYGEYFVPIADPSEHWDRLSIYLYLKGQTASSVRALLHSPSLLTGPDVYMVGHRRLRSLEDPSTHAKAVAAVEDQLLPRMTLLDQHPERVRERFRRFARVFVVEAKARPIFSRARLEESLELTTVWRAGSIQVLEARPKRSWSR